MTIPHEPWLVALSIAIAIQGSFVGLSLARELDSAEGFRRRLALAGSALTLATGVWSMHFVGMLAANFPSAIDYLVLPTLISFLICVIVVGIGVYAAHASGPPAFRVASGALAMGLGISLMHYVGMSAVHLAGPTSYAPSYVVASIAVSIAASAFALWAIDSRPTRPRLFLGAIALGLAISGMHYTAMAGMRLDPLCFDVSRFVGAEFGAVAQHARPARHGRLVRRLRRLSALAGARRAAPPERRRGRSGRRRRPRAAPLAAHAPEPATESPRRRPLAPPPSRWKRTGARANSPSPTSTPSAPTPITPMSTTASRNISATCRSARFEARLDPKAFLRVHRSYIVSVDRIARVKRSGEAGVAELGLPVRCSIPIARAHYRQVKLRIGALAG